MDAKKAIRDIMRVNNVRTGQMAEMIGSNNQRVCDRLGTSKGANLRVDILVEFANALGYKVVLMKDETETKDGWYEVTNEETKDTTVTAKAKKSSKK